MPGLRAVLFDVFGTVVDWRTGVTAELAAFGQRAGVSADWTAVADEWRGRYQPAMEDVRSGRRPFVPLDTLHRESLDAIFAERGISAARAELDDLTHAWHRLDPWPDVLGGLARLRSRFTIGTLSNGNTTLLEHMAARARLPWDVVLGAETAGAYKPLPGAYLHSVRHLKLRPEEVMLAAAHNSDLAAAGALDLRTAFIARRAEYGPDQTTDLGAEGDWDIVARDVNHLADALGCP